MHGAWNRLNELHRGGKATGGKEPVDDWDPGSLAYL